MPILFKKDDDLKTWHEKLDAFLQQIIDHLEEYNINYAIHEDDGSVRFHLEPKDKNKDLPSIQIGLSSVNRSRFWGLGWPLINSFLFYFPIFDPIDKMSRDHLENSFPYQYRYKKNKSFVDRLNVFTWVKWRKLFEATQSQVNVVSWRMKPRKYHSDRKMMELLGLLIEDQNVQVKVGELLNIKL